jgi:predicted  nucleic acid-binding Zn-ribbon protein
MGQQFLNVRSTKIKVGRYTNDTQADNSIILNASNVFIGENIPNSTYISPIRLKTTNETTFIGYDRDTKEIIDTGIKTNLLDCSSPNVVSNIIEFTNSTKIDYINSEISGFKNRIYKLENETYIDDFNKSIIDVKKRIIDYSPEIASIKNSISINESTINRNINDIRSIEEDNIQKIKSLENRFFKQITILPTIKSDIFKNISRITDLENKYINHTPEIQTITTKLTDLNNSLNISANDIINIQNNYKNTDVKLLETINRVDILDDNTPKIRVLETKCENIPKLLDRTYQIELNIPRISDLETKNINTNKDILKLNEKTYTLENNLQRITNLEHESNNTINSLLNTTNRVNVIENTKVLENYFRPRPLRKSHGPRGVLLDLSFEDGDIITGSTVSNSLEILRTDSKSNGNILSINEHKKLVWVDTINLKNITSENFYGNGSNINSLNMNNVNEGILKTENGGTGISNYAPGDLLYADECNNFKRLPILKNSFLTCTDKSIKWTKNIEEINSNIHINTSLFIKDNLEVNGIIKQRTKPIFSVSLLKKAAYKRKIIEWDTIDLNITNSFIDNAFIAPVCGYYSFSLRMVTNGCTNLNVELRKNGISIEKCNYIIHESNIENSACNSTILQLSEKDEITVYILSGQMANHNNEFCGYLIEPL